MSRQITPEQLHWLFSAQLVLVTVLGGTRHFLGPVVGAFTFVAVEDISLRLVAYRSMALGVLLIAVVFTFPGGVAGSATQLVNKWARQMRA